jgi:hypothetical protein
MSLIRTICEFIFGCGHDWETLRSIDEGSVLWHGEHPAPVYGNNLRLRVCLRCGVIDDQITKAIVEKCGKELEKSKRKDYAKQIVERHQKQCG